MEDIINIEILEDGTVKMETDKVSQANHVNAEGFIRECANKLGGKHDVKHKHGAQAHTHKHGEEHHHH